MRRVATVFLVVALLAACGDDGRTADQASIADDVATSPTSSAGAEPAAVPTSAPTPTTLPTTPRPDWLLTRALPLRADGLGEIQPTPDELIDRRFATVDLLPPPDSDRFRSTVGSVPDDVLARSTWSAACPVGRSDLRYLTVSFWGFEGLPHTGELLVHVNAVDTVVAGFEHLFARRFPIEEMRITRADELDVPPTGDGNNTSAFVCRPSVRSSTWSQHAYGRAVDINPFHNPYVSGDLVIPELASVYAARPDLPGVLSSDDIAGFTTAGWTWGGTWRSATDHMHVSADGS